MITLYHASKTRSVRIYWLLEELGQPYERKTIQFTPEVIKGAEYKAMHPLGKLPALQDGDVTMFESGAILEYLLEKYGNGRLAPQPGTAERAKFLQWIHFAEATALPPLSDMAQHMMFKPEAERIPAMVADGQARFVAILDMLEQELTGKEYLVGGQFSGADIMLGYSLLLSKLFGLLNDSHPAVNAYFGRLAQRPAFQKASA